MSMHIKSPAGIPDVDIGSVRIKTNPIEVAVESGGYSGTGVNQEGKLIGPDDSGNLTEIRCRVSSIPYLTAGSYTISTGPGADNDIQFAITLAELVSHEVEDEQQDKYVLQNTYGGGWNPTGPLTLTLASAAYVIVTIRKEDNAAITPGSVGGKIIIREEV